MVGHASQQITIESITADEATHFCRFIQLSHHLSLSLSPPCIMLLERERERILGVLVNLLSELYGHCVLFV